MAKKPTKAEIENEFLLDKIDPSANELEQTENSQADALKEIEKCLPYTNQHKKFDKFKLKGN